MNNTDTKNILITGATGNIGREVIRSLIGLKTLNRIIAGVRDIDKAKQQFQDLPNVDYVPFDFEDPVTFKNAFHNIRCLFLLRPPHISNVKKFFVPLITAAGAAGISQIVFLSVQGAQTSSIIPHNKIEKLITNSGIDHIFVRPSYFMQNLTTTLAHDIRKKSEIVLPAGNAKFNWVDVNDIGEASALFIRDFTQHRNNAYEITGYENESFQTVTNRINQIALSTITYRSMNPISYFLLKKREGIAPGLIMVMILLHVLPRFQKEPQISSVFESITGKKPTSLNDFIRRETHSFRTGTT